VYQHGQVVRGTLISLRYIHNSRQQSYRVAVVVSRKVSKSAVVRNRIRRRVYEIIRKHAQLLAGPYDLVFTAYAEEVAQLSHTSLQKVILDELDKAGTLHKAATPGVKHAIVDKKETNT
jgi:ribonuclease P protein component